MSTIRIAPRERYTNVPRATAEDTRLSWGARGLLTWLLGKPDDWKISRDHLVTQSPDGITKVRTLLRELADAGYLVRTRVRLQNGTFSTETVLHQYPQDSVTGGRKSTSGATSTFAENDQEPPLVDSPPADQPPAVNAPVGVITDLPTTDQIPPPPRRRTKAARPATRERSVLEQEADRITAEVAKVRPIANPAAYQRAVAANLATRPPPAPAADPLAGAIAVGYNLADVDEDTDTVIELIRAKFAGNSHATAAAVAALLEARGVDVAG